MPHAAAGGCQGATSEKDPAAQEAEDLESTEPTPAKATPWNLFNCCTFAVPEEEPEPEVPLTLKLPEKIVDHRTASSVFAVLIVIMYAFRVKIFSLPLEVVGVRVIGWTSPS